RGWCARSAPLGRCVRVAAGFVGSEGAWVSLPLARAEGRRSAPVRRRLDGWTVGGDYGRQVSTRRTGERERASGPLRGRFAPSTGAKRPTVVPRAPAPDPPTAPHASGRRVRSPSVTQRRRRPAATVRPGLTATPPPRPPA